MPNSNKVANAAIMPVLGALGQFSEISKTWIMMFPLAIFALFVCEPPALVALNLAVALMFGMMLVAQYSVANSANERAFAVNQQFVSGLASAQFACLIWVAILAGRMLFGAPLTVSTLGAFAVLALIVLLEGLVSCAILLAVERANGTSGASIAALISSKYAGLLGKIA